MVEVLVLCKIHHRITSDPSKFNELLAPEFQKNAERLCFTAVCLSPEGEGGSLVSGPSFPGVSRPLAMPPASMGLPTPVPLTAQDKDGCAGCGGSYGFFCS